MQKTVFQMNSTDRRSYIDISPVTSSFKGKATFLLTDDVSFTTSSKNNTLLFYGSLTV